MSVSVLVPTTGQWTEVAGYAALADELGYDSINCSHIRARDSFTTLAAWRAWRHARGSRPPSPRFIIVRQRRWPKPRRPWTTFPGDAFGWVWEPAIAGRHRRRPGRTAARQRQASATPRAG
jgi:hypothetical protein